MSDPFVPLDLSAAYNAGTGNVESESDKLWPAPDDAPDHTPPRESALGRAAVLGRAL